MKEMFFYLNLILNIIKSMNNPWQEGVHCLCMVGQRRSGERVRMIQPLEHKDKGILCTFLVKPVCSHGSLKVNHL